MRASMKTALLAGALVCAVAGFIGGASAQAADAAAGLELHKLTLSKSAKGGRLLKVSLQPEARCNLGDLDAISLDLQQLGEAAELQVAVEILGGADQQVFYGKPSGSGVSSVYTLTLPEFKKPAVLGLFLCTGSKKGAKAPCSGKKLESYRNIFAPYTIDMSRAAVNGKVFGPAPAPQVDSKAVGDRIYYFRFMVAEGGALEFPTKPMTKEGYDALMTTLQAKQAVMTDSATLRARLEELGGVLASVPLVPVKGGVKLTLPFYDKRKCEG